MLNSEEKKYTIEIIMGISFPNLKIRFESDNIIKLGEFYIEFNLMDEKNFHKLIDGSLKFDYIDNFDNSFSIPIFNTNKSLVSKYNNKIKVNADIVTLPFLLLSRKEELYIKDRDEHNRFVFSKSLSNNYNLIDFPIVDEYALLLRKTLSKVFNFDNDFNQKSIVYLTHDVDNFHRFSSFLTNIKTIIGGDLLARKSFKLFKQSLKELIETKKRPLNDPKIKVTLDYNRNNKKNVETHFFFLAYDKKDYDYRYDIYDKRISQVLNEIERKNNYWGLHCGFNGYDNNDIFSAQLKRIEHYGKVKENRNHYLKFDVKKTIPILEKNNIEYDYTLGYSERVGFKCGTCHEYNLFNFKENRKSTIIERPLIVMDGSLKQKMCLTEKEALNKIIYLYNICKRVNGNFVILWHPDSAIREWKNYYDNVYLKFLEVLDEEKNNNSV